MHSTRLPDLDAFVREAEAFVAAHHPPVTTESSRAATSFSVLPEKPAEVEAHELAEALAWRRTAFDAGYGWIDGPVEHGGRGLPAHYADAYRGVERRYQVPDEAYTRFSVAILCPTLLEHADETLRAELLTPLRRADLVSCQLFSEPDAGSDLASVRTRARRDGDTWTIDGQKVWTSGAHYSQVGLVLARTEPGSERHRGLTAFLLDMDQPGVEVRPIRQMTGGAAFSEVFLDGATVPDARRIGPEGQGWSVIMATMRHERSVIGTDGGADLALLDQLAVVVAGDPDLRDDPAVLERIGDVLVRGRGGAAATQAFLAASDGEPGSETSLSKLLLTDNLHRLSELAQDVLLDRAVVRSGDGAGYAWNQLTLSLEGLRIGGGTDEILRTVVAERVLGLPRDAPSKR